MKILICGDSFCTTDPNYPGLHWSEKIVNFSENFEVCNLAMGGSSNALIAYQLGQCLILKPDFVIMSFTNEGRYEIDNNVDAKISDITALELVKFQNERYTTNRKIRHSPDRSEPTTRMKQLNAIDNWILSASSENFERLKNYFYISFCLATLKARNIPFCFSLGGFEFEHDYQNLLKSNYLPNFIAEYAEQELFTNLWNHRITTKVHGKLTSPWFHVGDENIHTLFANDCIRRITNKEKLC